MTEEEFRQYFLKERAAYEAWGDFVVSEICCSLHKQLGQKKTEAFLKLKPTPRLKEFASAVGKIGRKGYKDPVKQITDLVGVRFVVLLSNDIETVCKIIENNGNWNATISKDYLEDIEKNPKLFDYQSKHFEIRPKNTIKKSNITITEDICCEVQVRTLLQHAYAELVHDSVYKPAGAVPKKAERQIARSMALMETTDELFCCTMDLLENTNKPRNIILKNLITLYKDQIGEKYLQIDEKIKFCFLDKYLIDEKINFCFLNKDLIFDEKEFLGLLSALLDDKKYICEKIKKRVDDNKNSFFSQPVIIFTYWLVFQHTTNIEQFMQEWPLPGYSTSLDLVISDCGISKNNN